MVHSNAKNHINGHLFIWLFLFFLESFQMFFSSCSLSDYQSFLKFVWKICVQWKKEKQLWFCLKIHLCILPVHLKRMAPFRRNHGKGSHRNKMKSMKNRGIMRTYFYHKVCRHFIVRDCMLGWPHHDRLTPGDWSTVYVLYSWT